MKNPFLTLWIRPRATIRFLHENQNWLSQLQMMFGLVFCYFLLVDFSLWSVDCLAPFSEIFSQKGLVCEGKLLFVLLYFIFVLFYLSALIFYSISRFLFAGKSTFFQTLTIVHWAGVTTFPLAVCYVLALWSSYAGRTKEIAGGESYFYDFILFTMALCVVFFALYSLAILMKMLSETHKISLWRATVTVVGGIAVECPFLFILYLYYFNK